jgi:HEAT repeat protein
MVRPLGDDVEEILTAVRTQPLHVYWHGLWDQRRRLFAHGDEALALVVPLLGDPEQHVRRYFARLVRDLDRRRAASVLEPLLSDPDEEVRLEAGAAILWEPAMEPERKANPERPVPPLSTSTRAAFVSALLPLLASTKFWVAEETVHLFERLGGFEHVNALVARLPEPEWNRRNLIFSAIARSPDRVVLLSQLLAHSDPETRSSACVQLAHLPTPPDPGLSKAIVARLDDVDEDVRWSATLAVGRLGLVDGEEKLLTMPNARGVIQALGLLRSERGLELALAHVKPGDPLLSEAIRAVTRFGRRPAIEDALLAVLANDPEPYSRKRAADALVELDCVRAIPALEHFLKKGARELAKRSRKEVLRSLPYEIERLKRLSAAEPDA